MISISELCKKIKKATPEVIDLIERAYSFAERVHAGVKRLSGDPFITHCLAVADILADLNLDPMTIAAGLLHDAIEESPEDKRQHIETELTTQFGKEIAFLVEGVTKVSTKTFPDKDEFDAENLRKMILAMAEDIRVVLIKLADRLHNMRTLEFLPTEKQKKIATSTLEIFAPISHRLGIFRITQELEDLSFRFLYPDVYFNLVKEVKKKQKRQEEYIENVKAIVMKKLEENNIDARIEGRLKHFYSIYQKMLRQNVSLDEIYDLMAVRIITKTIRDCYSVLGLVHELWKPIEGRFRDFIASPKPNLYQSLHTTVVGPENELLEVQIRTEEMHQIAETGIAAHWLYKEGKQIRRKEDEYEKRFTWLRQALEWLRDTGDAREFMEAIQKDLFKAEVYVLTPKGDVKELPAGSTPIDFAYAVHTEIGHHCVAAKVNGKLVPLRYQLKSGDRVEIITSKSAHPTYDWLEFVRTSRARSKINQYLRQVEREKHVSMGKEKLLRELKRAHLTSLEILKSENVEKIINSEFKFSTLTELFIAIGVGSLSAKQVVNKISPVLFAENKEIVKDKSKFIAQPKDLCDKSIEKEENAYISSAGLSIKGIGEMLLRFAKCCHPICGDPVIGFITRGRGLSIHKKDCTSIAPFLSDKNRVIEVNWDDNIITTQLVPIKIEAFDRPGLSRDIFSEIAALNINVHSHIARPVGQSSSIQKTKNLSSFKFKDSQKRRVLLYLILEVNELNQLNTILDRIRKVPDVISAVRTSRRNI